MSTIPAPMLVDYHNHTVLCHHAFGTVQEYLDRAEARGIAEYGFAEHSWWMIRSGDRELCPDQEGTQKYLHWMDRFRAHYDGTGGRLRLRVGLEADWVPDRLQEAKSFIDSYPFDFILGSVHHLRDERAGVHRLVWDFDEEDMKPLYDRYFTELAALARSGLCDCLSHIDVVRKKRREPAGGALPYIEKLIPAILDGGVAVEINTSGKNHPIADFYPSREALAMLVAAGVPITLGSDGHRPEHVGRFLTEAVEMLRSVGGKEIVRFEARRKIPTPV